MEDAHNAEQRFYSRYDWCLNPILSIQELLHRLETELEQYPALTGWEREESKINLYLFACAIACTADDYFGQKLKDLSQLVSRLPQLRLILRWADWILNTTAWLLRMATHWRAWRWRRRWTSFVEEICGLVLTETELRTDSDALLHVRLPKRLLKRRMRLPEAFRGQDFTHHDVISLVKRFCESSRPNDVPITIVGLRTAGAYFAPLMAAYLKESDWSRVTWFSMRPKNGTSPWENYQLRKQGRKNHRVLLVDDYPATGATFRLALDIFQKAKIRPEQISILAPTHQAQPNWVALAKIPKETPVFTVHPWELYKAALLMPDAVERWCAAYIAGIRVTNDKDTDTLNKRLADHSKDGHHVREKRVFAIESPGENCARQPKKIFIKSVGWGWLGYHAYLAGRRLDPFVPRLIGMRNGLLAAEWIDGVQERPAVPADEQMINVLASYVAARSRYLRLAGDCRFESRNYRWTGTDDIVRIFRAAYGPYMSRLKEPSLREKVHKYVNSAPTLVDGRMRPEEWLRTPDGIYKADFEHHNFGGGEADIADPAYDLAAAILEFHLSGPSEEELLEIYMRKSGDKTIRERIIIYKIFYASRLLRYATDLVTSGKEPRKNNELRHYAWDFLVYSMNGFCAGLIGPSRDTEWSDSLFFVDLDGVFDEDILGFPHATQSGLQSLMLLQSNGYSVVLNTARSVQHVRKYCEAYGLPGGVAELGGVFVDAVRKTEVPLVNREGLRQLTKCREVIGNLPGVFLDPGFEYSIRAYRYRGGNTVGLPIDEIRKVLGDHEFGQLTYLSRSNDTCIVQNGTGKGAGLTFVKRYLNKTRPVAAIGDAEPDVSMLNLADYAYAPANCSAAVRQLAKAGHCRVLRQSCQAGFLAAVQHRLKSDGIRTRQLPDLFRTPGTNSLIQTVLCIADSR